MVLVSNPVEEESQSVVVGLMKEVRVDHADKMYIHVEYWLLNFWLLDTWAVALYVFQGRDMKSYRFNDPLLDIGAELYIEPGAILRVDTDRNVILECPARASIRIRDIKYK